MKPTLLLTLLVLGACQIAEPETHLIPEGYVGPVYIVQDQMTGEPEEYEEGRRLYRIAADGVLLTQFGPNDGYQSDRFYRVGTDGERREITARSYSNVHDTPANRADTTIGVHLGGVGVIGRESVPYTYYFVGSKADLLEWDSGRDDVFAALEQRGVRIE